MSLAFMADDIDIDKAFSITLMHDKNNIEYVPLIESNFLSCSIWPQFTKEYRLSSSASFEINRILYEHVAHAVNNCLAAMVSHCLHAYKNNLFVQSSAPYIYLNEFFIK